MRSQPIPPANNSAGFTCVSSVCIINEIIFLDEVRIEKVQPKVIRSAFKDLRKRKLKFREHSYKFGELMYAMHERFLCGQKTHVQVHSRNQFHCPSFILEEILVD